MDSLGRNISFPIKNADGTPFENLVLHKATYESVVMSLADKITGDVYYKNNQLVCTMQEYIKYENVRYYLVNPPTIVREGIVSDNSELKGMTKYSFEFYHPMYKLNNIPFSDVAVSNDEKRYLSENKSFYWIGKPDDFIAKLNKNLDNTEWVVIKSDYFPKDKVDMLSEVLQFDNNTIGDALQKLYETWGVAFVISQLKENEYYNDIDYYNQGKRFVIIVGNPSNEVVDKNALNGIVVNANTLATQYGNIHYHPTPITVPAGVKILVTSLEEGLAPLILNSTHDGVIGSTNRTFDTETTVYVALSGEGRVMYSFDGSVNNIYVFKFGQGVGLKNNSRTPRNNKIVTRIAGYGSENNIPYGYPQIRWYGNPNWEHTAYETNPTITNVDTTPYSTFESSLDAIIQRSPNSAEARAAVNDFASSVYNGLKVKSAGTTSKQNASGAVYTYNWTVVTHTNYVEATYHDANGDWHYLVSLQGGNVTEVSSATPSVNSYPLYKGIVGGEYVMLIKHPFTRTHLMPSVYSEAVFNKVSPYLSNGNANPNYNPDIELVDYYDAISDSTYTYPNEINPQAPSYDIHEFDVKPELEDGEPKNIVNAIPINDKDSTPASGWDDTMNDNAEYNQGYFRITLPVLDFDVYACAAITQEMQINMRSGACIGCTFTVQVDWEDYKKNFWDDKGNFVPNGTQRDYVKYPKSNQQQIDVIVQKETSTFGTLMPNVYQNPKAGDSFVILGISLPLSYISNAEIRLDNEMKAYMLSNNIYYYDYPLKFDSYFLANRTDILSQIKTNTIIRFLFGEEQLHLYVKQIVIKYGDSPLPQYDITLTDNIEVVLNQIGQVAKDIERLGALISNTKQASTSVSQQELNKKLSKVSDDETPYTLTMGGAHVTGELEVEGQSTQHGNEVHLGIENHFGSETHNGEESHTNYETHTGDEEHGGNVNITKNLSIDEGAIAEILGTMFFGRGDGFVSGLNGNGGKIDSEASAELKDLFVRELATIVRGIFNELVSSHPTSKVGEWFQQGFNGHGTKIWYDQETGWNMELDTLTVRRIMYIFELVIQKIRSVGGILIVSAANGKIKEVQKVKCEINGSYEEYYKIKFEDTNTFVRHDLMRCQRWNNGRYNDVTKDDDAELPDARAMQYYWVEVGYPDSAAFNYPPLETPDNILLCDDDWNVVLDELGNEIDADFSTAYDILVPRSEFGKTAEVVDPTTQETIILPADTEPQVGDDCVLMGNTQYTKRQNYIYISATEDGVPRIDVMDGCNSKGDGGNLRCRLGCLDGINDSYWGLEQPSGYGLYSDNAWLKGKFIIRIGDRDRDVSTMFEVLDGMIRSSVSSLREDTIGGEGCISNNVFTDGLDKWGIYGEGRLLTDGTKALHDGINLLAFFGFTEYAKLVEDNGTFAVEMKGSANSPHGIIQLHSDMHDVPIFETNNGAIVPRTFAISFYARSAEVGGTNVVVEIGDAPPFTIAVAQSEKFKKYVHTLDLTSVGDFAIYTHGGAVQVRGIVVSVDIDEAMIDRLVSRIEQIPDSITGIVEAFTLNQTTGKYELSAFTSFKAAYGEWQTSVYDVFVNNTNSKFTQLSDSITSSVNALVPISENDYIYDPSFGGGLDYITKWNLAEESSSRKLVIGTSGGEKYFDILNNSAETPVGFFPALKNTSHDEEVSSKATEICLSVRCISSATIVVRQDTGGGNTEEIYRKSLTPSLTYELVRFNAPWKFGNIYIGVLGVNAQVYISSACMADDGKAVMAELSSRITQTQSSITSTVQTAVQNATGEFNTRISTLEQIDSSFTFKIDSLMNTIFSNINAPFDYEASSDELTQQDLAVCVRKISDSTGDYLHIDDSDENGITVSFGLSDLANDSDMEPVKVRIRGKADDVTTLRIYYGSGSNDYIDITSDFTGDAITEHEYTINFVIDYGVEIFIYGGVFDIYGIYGKPNTITSPVSVLKLTQKYFEAYVSEQNYIDSTELTNALLDYAPKNYVDNAVGGVFSSTQFSTIFQGYIENGRFTIASQIKTFVSYKTDQQGNVIRDANGKAELEGGVLIKADAINLEGYTTINGNFKVDEYGNVEMNNCTIAGVLNNLIQQKKFASNESVWNLNPLQWGSIIEYTPFYGGSTTTYEIRLPSLYSDSQGAHIEYAKVNGEFSGMTSDDMRQCIGKKLYLFCNISGVGYTMTIKSRFLVQVFDGSMTFDDSNGEIADNSVIPYQPTYTKVSSTQIQATQVILLECCLGQFNGKECIYWKVEGSMQRSDTEIYVYGRLVNRSNVGLPNVTIQFKDNDDENIIFQCQTDSNGYYACRVTALKEYSVIAFDSSTIPIEGEAGQNLAAFEVESNSVALNLITTNN